MPNIAIRLDVRARKTMSRFLMQSVYAIKYIVRTKNNINDVVIVIPINPLFSNAFAIST